MGELSLRLAMILILSLSVLGLIWATWRLWIGRKKQPQASLQDSIIALQVLSQVEDTSPARVCILAFASEDCHQCHRLQAPVLRRVKETHGDIITIVDIDASSAPELTSRYHILTVPTTVLLDVKGKAHAVNYGFTNAQSLLKQVDEILVLDDV
jgi:thioredoxin-related protein